MRPTTTPRHEGRMGDGGAHSRILRPVRPRDEGCDASPIQSAPSSWVGWCVVVSLCHTVSQNVNVVLLQHATDLLNIIHIHAGNANAALNLTITVLNNFDLKRDAVQPEDDLPAQ